MTEAITLHIDGMTCSSCAEHVRQALEKVPGVRSASVSYPQQRAEIQAETSTKVTCRWSRQCPHSAIERSLPMRQTSLMVCWTRHGVGWIANK
jgi:copper chaperone CopZ